MLILAAPLTSWLALADFQYYNEMGAVCPVEKTYHNAEHLARLDLPRANSPPEHIAWCFIWFYTHWYDKARTRPGSIPRAEPIIEYVEDHALFNSAFSRRSWHVGGSDCPDDDLLGPNIFRVHATART